MFNKLRTRKGRLKQKIEKELEGGNPDISKIIKAVEDFEKDNIDTINKLKRGKRIDLNRINGALRQTINAHGPINKTLIGSASKRIYGAILLNPNEKDKRISIKSLLFGIFIGIIITLTIIL